MSQKPLVLLTRGFLVIISVSNFYIYKKILLKIIKNNEVLSL